MQKMATPLRIDTIVISTQHDEFILPINKSADAVEKANKAMQERIKHDVMTILVPRVREKYKYREEIYRLFDDTIRCFVNPTGKFVFGRSTCRYRLTGRKIIVDTMAEKFLTEEALFRGKILQK